MKIIKYIPVSLFVLCSSIYDLWAPSIKIEILEASANDVSWSIFYFVSLYLAWLIHIIYEAYSTDLYYFGALGVGFLIRIIIELNKIGMTYDQYIHSVSNIQSVMLLNLWITLTLLIPLIKWKKYKDG